MLRKHANSAPRGNDLLKPVFPFRTQARGGKATLCFKELGHSFAKLAIESVDIGLIRQLMRWNDVHLRKTVLGAASKQQSLGKQGNGIELVISFRHLTDDATVQRTGQHQLYATAPAYGMQDHLRHGKLFQHAADEPCKADRRN